MKKMSLFPIERKEAEGEEDPLSEEKATKQSALLPQTYIAPRSDQYKSRDGAILVEARSNSALRVEQYCFEYFLQKKRPPPPKERERRTDVSTYI